MRYTAVFAGFIFLYRNIPFIPSVIASFRYDLGESFYGIISKQNNL